MQRKLWLAGVVAIAACATPRSTTSGNPYRLTPLVSGTNASMRGIAVVNAQTAWASGTAGSVLRTTDGGATWTLMRVPDADSLDFRDVAAFDANNAYVLSAGEDGRIYRTTDAGKSWQLVFRNTTKGAFFDCFDFWDATHGIAMSDPVGGHFLIVRTNDGIHWSEMPTSTSPKAMAGEAAFAASGTCLITQGSRKAYLATGGGAQTHVFVSNDQGNSWVTSATPLPAGAPPAGIFSLAFKDEKQGVAIGGNYEKPANEFVVAVTRDGGSTWQSAGTTAYVSGAAFVKGTNTIAAVGTKGTRISNDGGFAWMTIDTVEYNAVQFAKDGTGYAVGPRGRIAKIR